jgi:hypothetical protein
MVKYRGGKSLIFRQGNGISDGVRCLNLSARPSTCVSHIQGDERPILNNENQITL